MDPAFLRRIPYKLLLRSPTKTSSTTIFREILRRLKSLKYEDGLIARFIDEHYRKNRPGHSGAAIHAIYFRMPST